jgi:hypothetical protein
VVELFKMEESFSEEDTSELFTLCSLLSPQLARINTDDTTEISNPILFISKSPFVKVLNEIDF